MARRTKQEAEETRQRIIDAAERTFRAKGVAHASLEDVARAARVTRGAIYWHFRDKGELFQAMMERVELPAQVLMERARRDGAADPLQQLRHSACNVLLRAARDAQVQRVFEIGFHKCEYVGDAASIRGRQLRSQDECLKAIEKGFRDCVKAGLVPRELDPRRAAIGAMAHVSGILYLWLLEPRRFDLEKEAEALVDTYFRGIAVSTAIPRVRGKKPSVGRGRSAP